MLDRFRDRQRTCRPAARPWILATTILASGMVFIDGTVVNVALPALQREFDAGVGEAQWVVESYALMLTITVAPLTTTVMNALDTTLAGAASGVNNAISRAAALLAIAVLGIVMNHAFDHALAQHTWELPVSPAVLAQVEAQRDRLAAIDGRSHRTATSRSGELTLRPRTDVYQYEELTHSPALGTRDVSRVAGRRPRLAG